MIEIDRYGNNEEVLIAVRHHRQDEAFAEFSSTEREMSELEYVDTILVLDEDSVYAGLKTASGDIYPEKYILYTEVGKEHLYTHPIEASKILDAIKSNIGGQDNGDL